MGKDILKTPLESQGSMGYSWYKKYAYIYIYWVLFVIHDILVDSGWSKKKSLMAIGKGILGSSPVTVAEGVRHNVC